LSLGQQVNDLHDKVARKNFRVLIIIPEEVEQIDLSEPDQARRWKFTYVGGEGGDWKKEELWP
jgi:pyridoxamine 5'-phosphate oxidase